MDNIELAFIGGSGIYKIPGFKDYEWLNINSNFGIPSSKICIGNLNKKKIAFLPRHGINHNISPTKINYKANIECLKKLNVKNIISISAVGSLREDFKPGEFVLVDQYIDRTTQREQSFFNEGIVAHIQFSDPICKNLKKISKKILIEQKINYHENGTYVCIEGPQFSTLAESQLYRSWGCDVIGMTNIPEAKLAKEAGICYASLCMVTDYDCWHPKHDQVSVNEIIATLNQNSKKAIRFIKSICDQKNILCDLSSEKVLKDAIITNIDKIPEKLKSKFKNILPKNESRK